VTNAATSTSTANATTIPQMNGSAVSAEPIKTATPTRKAIPSTMKTTHKTSLRVMMRERSTTPEFDPDPAGLPPSGNPYIRLARRLLVDVSLPCSPTGRREHRPLADVAVASRLGAVVEVNHPVAETAFVHQFEL
jgi:hypothetical protein